MLDTAPASSDGSVAKADVTLNISTVTLPADSLPAHALVVTADRSSQEKVLRSKCLQDLR